MKNVKIPFRNCWWKCLKADHSATLAYEESVEVSCMLCSPWRRMQFCWGNEKIFQVLFKDGKSQKSTNKALLLLGKRPVSKWTQHKEGLSRKILKGEDIVDGLKSWDSDEISQTKKAKTLVRRANVSCPFQRLKVEGWNIRCCNFSIWEGLPVISHLDHKTLITDFFQGKCNAEGSKPQRKSFMANWASQEKLFQGK